MRQDLDGFQYDNEGKLTGYQSKVNPQDIFERIQITETRWPEGKCDFCRGRAAVGTTKYMVYYVYKDQPNSTYTFEVCEEHMTFWKKLKEALKA